VNSAHVKGVNWTMLGPGARPEPRSVRSAHRSISMSWRCAGSIMQPCLLSSASNAMRNAMQILWWQMNATVDDARHALAT
jgi:hypothetical protein